MNYVKLGQERFSELVNKMGVDCVGTKMTKTELRIAELEADRDRLREALEQIGNVLGPGTCAACQCEGCAWETKEAVRLATSALSATREPKHPDTVKHCCGESGFGREWPGEQRDVCPACAKLAEQWERETLEKALVRVIEEAERG